MPRGRQVPVAEAGLPSQRRPPPLAGLSPGGSHPRPLLGLSPGGRAGPYMPRGPPGRYPRLRQAAFPEPPCPSRARVLGGGRDLTCRGDHPAPWP